MPKMTRAEDLRDTVEGLIAAIRRQLDETLENLNDASNERLTDEFRGQALERAKGWVQGLRRCLAEDALDREDEYIPPTEDFRFETEAEAERRLSGGEA